MKIAFFRHSLFNRGGDKMVLAYAGRLAEKGHQVELFTNITDTIFNIPHAVAVRRLKVPGRLGTIVTALIKKVDADIVVGDIVATAFLLSCSNRGRVVLFAQDYNENIYRSIFLKLFIRFLYKVTFSFFKVPTIAVSVPLADELNSRFNAHAKVIENGIDLKTFYADPCEVLNESKKGHKAILFFSRRDHRKGFDLALETIGNVIGRTEIPIEVWTVGEPLLEGEVACAHHDFGYVAEAELRRIFSSADVFLYPSRFEGFPVMVLEAFACECPVVTTDAISYAVHGVNALVAQIDNVDGLVSNVEQILTDKKLALTLTGSARQFVQKYSLDFASEEFEIELKKTIQSHG